MKILFALVISLLGILALLASASFDDIVLPILGLLGNAEKLQSLILTMRLLSLILTSLPFLGIAYLGRNAVFSATPLCLNFCLAISDYGYSVWGVGAFGFVRPLFLLAAVVALIWAAQKIIRNAKIA